MADIDGDLDELFERLALCQAKARVLHSQIVYLGQRSVKWWVEPWDPTSGAVRARLLQAPPVSLRAEIGMLVNEQRAILDSLACCLAVRNGANNVGDVSFPITKTESVFHERVTEKKIKKISQADRSKIEALKPWNFAPSHESFPALFSLHEADKTRKHQKLLEWACVGGAKTYGLGRIGAMRTGSVIFTDTSRIETIAEFRDITTQLAVDFQLIYTEPPSMFGGIVSAHLDLFNAAVEEALSVFS